MLILGIETSCDETAAAVVEQRRGRLTVRASVVNSQIAIHRRTGGVVPEVAARQHVEVIIPVIDAALQAAGVRLADLDRIAVTRGPGLVTSLLVGVTTAQGLSVASGLPLVGTNHLLGHILVNQLPPGRPWTARDFPLLALIVSGGHTELVLVKKIGAYRVVGRTQDDAAGECFDKTAKLLGLSYPGGPEIARLAATGNPAAVPLPRPMIDRPNFHFSFSGLKTAARLQVERHGRPRGRRQNDFCASLQAAIVDVLVTKTVAAAARYRVRRIVLGGGVSANHTLREQLVSVAKTTLPRVAVDVPPLAYCTDNGLLAAIPGLYEQPSRRPLAVDPVLNFRS